MGNRPQKLSSTLIYTLILLSFLLGGCAKNYDSLTPETHLAYVETDHNTPVFVTEVPDKAYNLIGTAKITASENGNERVLISPDEPTIYSESRSWSGDKGDYTNRIYRIHFPSVPFSLIPFHLIAGDNVGLLVIITMDHNEQPLLVTTVHTCGCYLAFLPTRSLPADYFPDEWEDKEQYIYGEYLPGMIDLEDKENNERLHILLRHSTHRVKQVWMSAVDDDSYRLYESPVNLAPLSSLTNLQPSQNGTVSFFETEGPRKDYVVGSQKFWERLLISWWAFDWRVGEDKRLGKDQSDGITFYTSLKPWAREESDMRNFSQFLHYWGWKF